MTVAGRNTETLEKLKEILASQRDMEIYKKMQEGYVLSAKQKKPKTEIDELNEVFDKINGETEKRNM